MELETNANPHVGSGVRDAVPAIEGLLESGNTGQSEEQAPEETQANPDSEETPVEEPVSQETEDDPSEKSADTEAETEAQEELPDTLDGWAEAAGVTADELAENHFKAPITVNGETRMVTLKELQKGYQLEADYRSKTTDLAEQRRTLEVHSKQAITEWQNRFQSQADLTEQLKEAVGEQEADLERILTDEGFEAHYAAKNKLDKRKELLAHATAEREQAETHQAEENLRKAEKTRQEQANLLVTALPDLADETKGPKLIGRIRTHLSSVGFNAQEIATVVDHRMLVVAHKAMLYDDLMKAKPATSKKLKGLPRVQKPGAAPEKGANKREKTTALAQRLRKTGTRQDAANVFEEFL